MSQLKSDSSSHQNELIGAIDQGTSSTRFLVFENGTGKLVASSQIQVERIVPKEGWVEMEPDSIIKTVKDTIENVCSGDDSIITRLKCIGICNQRESTIVWDKISGKALYNAILWMDNRTKDLVDEMVDSIPGRDINWIKDKTGLPISTYFSAFKLKWLIDNVEAVRESLDHDRLLFGTIDTWILWNLTNGKHLTDVTNASRTFLMDIETLKWDTSLCDYFKIPSKILPTILSSGDYYGQVQDGPLKGISITGVMGDQSAALFGHHCLQVGQTKATFGTGCFIMQNIGPGPLNVALSGTARDAKRGLITTVGYKLHQQPACYALEGSIKIAGAGFAWLRDNLQLISNFEECDSLVNKTTNSAGVFFVPALGGLYSPYWDPNASGIFIGLSQFSRREHLIRATFDAIAFQTNDILSLMRNVTSGLMIDGGLCQSNHMCQILADLTGCDIVRPSMCETSALGAAMMAGCGAGIWSIDSLIAKSNLPFDSYGFASSTNSAIKHHHPQQSLNYEEKFSALIESKSRNMSIQEQNGSKFKSDHSSSTVTHSKVERVNVAIGVNDDAGGGGPINNSAFEDNQSSQAVDEVELGSSSACDEDLYLASNCDAEPMNRDIVRPSSVGFASSGYSSGDNFELNSLIAQRQNSPFQEQEQEQEQERFESDICVTHGTSTSTLIARDNCHQDRSFTTSHHSQQQHEQQHQQVKDHIDIDQADSVIKCEAAAFDIYSSKPIAPLAPVDVFQSYISLEHRVDLVNTWHRAVERSMQWTKVHHEEVRRLDYQRLSSLPISVYLFLSIGMVALSGFMRSGWRN